jgi:hypothetical protein
MKKGVFFQFQTKNSKMLDIQVSYRNNQISSNTNVSFLGPKINNFLTRKNYIDLLIDKLNRSCFAVRSVKSILSLETLKMVYYSYVHSILNLNYLNLIPKYINSISDLLMTCITPKLT